MGSALVGRDAELARVAAWLVGRTTGTGPAALLVSGEAGVGKTALLAAVDTGSAVVLRAGGSPWRTSTPFGVLAQLLPAPATIDVPSVRAGVLGRAAGQPLVVILDDLHWADEATLDLLPSLIEELAADPVAVLGAYRSDELPRGHLLRPLRATLRQRRQLVNLALDPLRTDDVAALVATVVGGTPDPALVEAVAARTEGVPFFVEELTAALVATGRLTSDGGRVALPAGDAPPLPETVRDAVLLRAAGLSDHARAVLDVAAVAGTTFTAGTVTAIQGGDWPDELDSSGLLVVAGGDERRFRHALTQEAIYAEVPWSRRRELHFAFAALATDPATAALHLLAGRDFDAARPALLAAAAALESGHAYRDAARLLTTALETWPAGATELDRLTTIDRLARCAELCGDHARAVTGLRELASAEPSRPEVLRRLAAQHELLGQWPPALAAREQAAQAYVDLGMPGPAAAERLAMAAHLRSAASFRAALETLDVAERDAVAAARTDLVCRVTALRGNVLCRQGNAADGLPLVRGALERALADGLSAAAAEIYQRLADSLEHAADYRGASRAYDSAYEFCEVHDQSTVGQVCRACATVVMFHSGRWDRALAMCSAVLSDATASAHARAVATGVAGLVQAMRGQATRARATLLDARITAVHIGLVPMELLATWGLALVDEVNGHPDRAAESYRHVVRRCEETEERHYCVPVLQFGAALFAAADARADLGALTAVLADAADRSGSAEARAALAHAHGESALAIDGPQAAVSHYRRALDLLDGVELPIVDTLVRHRMGSALAGSTDGRTALRAAYQTAQRLKAKALMQRIGVDLGSEPTGADDLLTERELQVMQLVGDGLTSRAIAARLFLSARTVEMHVANAVAKLGCRTRTEAVRVLADRTTQV